MTADNWINLGMLFVAIISAIIAAGSLWFTYKQWQKIKKKIGMINTAGKAVEILPAWYIERMMPFEIEKGKVATEYWPFGLLTSDGRILVVTSITSLSDDRKWMDVQLAVEGVWFQEKEPNYIFAVAEDRARASVSVSHIVAALELASS